MSTNKMRLRAGRMVAAVALMMAAAAHGQACKEGEVEKCEELLVNDVSFGRFSWASHVAGCTYDYEYRLYANTGGKAKKIGSKYVTSSGTGGVTYKPSDTNKKTCDLIARVVFRSDKLPASVEAAFVVEVDNVEGARGDLRICVPKEPCDGGEKKKDNRGSMYLGPERGGARTEFASFFDPDTRLITYTVANTGNDVITFDWSGLRDLGLVDFRGVLGPGEKAVSWISAVAGAEALAMLHSDSESFGGLAAPVATVVPDRAGPCYADCDGNGRLDIRDFFCFQRKYAEGCR